MTKLELHVLSQASLYIGKKESGENAGFEDKQFEKEMRSVGWRPSWSWCMLFVKLCVLKGMKSAGFTEAEIKKAMLLITPSVMSTYNNFKKLDLLTDTIKEGAIVIWSKGNWTGHTGIVMRQYESDTTKYYIIEGNTSTASDANGDGVMLRRRIPNKTMKLMGYLDLEKLEAYVKNNQ